MQESSLPTTEILVKEILGDPDFNSRGLIYNQDVRELAKSIEKDGLHQPILVQPYDKKPPYRYRVVMGHRRLKAFESLKKETIPCVVKEGLDEATALQMNLVENLQRKDLTIMQEARAIERFHKAGVPRETVAKRLGVPSGWVQTRFNALMLPPEIQGEIDAGYITPTQIRDLHSIPSNDERFRLVREIKEAKIRGERVIIKEKAKKLKRNERRARTVTEIFAMQDAIRDAVGNNVGTRSLAWAAGEISDKEMYEELKRLADEMGLPYSIPVEFRS